MAVDLKSLPDEVQEYIKELRDENAERRRAYKTYEEAFKPYDEAQQRGLLHMIKMLAEDTEAGAMLFRDLANDILGADEQTTDKEEEEDMAKDEEEKDIKTIVAEAVAEALRAKDEADNEAMTKEEQEEFDRAVAFWDAEAKKLGYEPNTQEAADLFFMANKLGTSDLKEAHEKLTAFNQFIGGEEQEEKEGEEEEEEEKPSFPKAGGKGAGAPQVKGDEIDYTDDAAVRAALSKMLDSADA